MFKTEIIMEENKIKSWKNAGWFIIILKLKWNSSFWQVLAIDTLLSESFRLLGMC